MYMHVNFEAIPRSLGLCEETVRLRLLGAAEERANRWGNRTITNFIVSLSEVAL